jgi:thymidylate synthase ThyX
MGPYEILPRMEEMVIMNDNFPKYVLIFLAIVYLTASISEIIMVKNGAEAVFESAKTLVPHIGMFIMGFYFSKKAIDLFHKKSYRCHMIEAKIVADSVGPNGVRLTTFVLTYPRFIHSEMMTHRMFSRNASSSRAIPVKKQIQMVKDNPVIPLAFTKNKAGMQGGEALDGSAYDQALTIWLGARDCAIIMAHALADLEVHKQYANRILEPWAHITVVCTATDYANFFALRCHEMAQPEIHALADLMYEEYHTRTPILLEAGEWHLPFISKEEIEEAKRRDNGLGVCWENTIKFSVARCARVSYLNHEGKNPTNAEDLQLYDRLLGSAPIHASPAEHQAQALAAHKGDYRLGNLRGWLQYRKTLEGENVTRFTK